MLPAPSALGTQAAREYRLSIYENGALLASRSIQTTIQKGIYTETATQAALSVWAESAKLVSDCARRLRNCGLSACAHGIATVQRRTTWPQSGCAR